MKNVIIISEKQRKFLKEKKGVLFEYYSMASNPSFDSHILGNLQVWVYGDDRNKFTPHCHVFTKDKDIEIEVSIIDWEILNIKNGLPTKVFMKSFFKWLYSQSTRDKRLTNKDFIYILWDSNNPENTLKDFIKEHGELKIKDKGLENYIKNQEF